MMPQLLHRKVGNDPCGTRTAHYPQLLRSHLILCSHLVHVDAPSEKQVHSTYDPKGEFFMLQGHIQLFHSFLSGQHCDILICTGDARLSSHSNGKF